MQEKMSSRERVLAALQRKPVDYVPYAPFFNPLTVPQRIGHSWQWPFGPSEEEMAWYCLRELGLDPVVALPIGQYHPDLFMALYYRPDREVSARVWIERNEIHKLWSTPSGELHAAVRFDERWPHGRDIPFYSDFNIGHFVIPWLKSVADVRCLRHILRPLQDNDEIDRVRFDCARIKAFAERLGLATIAHVGLGLTGAMQLCGSEGLCLLMVEQPEVVHSYLELDHERNLRHIEIAAELGADIIRRNGFYETCDFFSPTMLEQFLGAHLREEIAAVHAAGKLIGYTVNTGVMPMLDYLAGLDFDALMHLEIAAPEIDLAQVRDKLAGCKSFWLGPSNAHHLCAADPEPVRTAVRRVFDALGKSGLILTPSPSMHSTMPWENFRAMVDEWKRCR